MVNQQLLAELKTALEPYKIESIVEYSNSIEITIKTSSDPTNEIPPILEDFYNRGLELSVIWLYDSGEFDRMAAAKAKK